MDSSSISLPFPSPLPHSTPKLQDLSENVLFINEKKNSLECSRCFKLIIYFVFSNISRKINSNIINGKKHNLVNDKIYFSKFIMKNILYFFTNNYVRINIS